MMKQKNNYMKLNKLQRYTVYCIMLVEYELDQYKDFVGFCGLWARVTGTWPLSLDTGNKLITILPEIYQKRTKEPDSLVSSWFCNWDERIAALEQCIKETHP